MDSRTKLQEKQSKVVELSKLIELHSNKRLTPKRAEEIQNLQFKLEFRLLQLEELGFDAKIESMTKVLHILQSIK